MVAKQEADAGPVLFLGAHSKHADLLTLIDIAVRIVKQHVERLPGAVRTSVRHVKVFRVRRADMSESDRK